MNRLSWIFLFLLLFPGVLCVAEQKAEPGKPTGSMVTVSRLAGDPGEITEENKELFHTSDGSPLETVRYDPNDNYETVTYSRSVLSEDVVKMNKEGSEFFDKERKQRAEFTQKIQAGSVSPEEVAEFRQEELKRRREFAQKQQDKLDEINCRDIETPVCDAVRERQKKFLGIF